MSYVGGVLTFTEVIQRDTLWLTDTIRLGNVYILFSSLKKIAVVFDTAKKNEKFYEIFCNELKPIHKDNSLRDLISIVNIDLKWCMGILLPKLEEIYDSIGYVPFAINK